MKKEKKDAIFFLLALAFALRIYNIDSPIIGHHAWRQADTAAMARNFYENGYKLLYPQIDWGGDSSGYVETEFPIYPFIVALFYKFFGVFELYGRLLSVIFSLVALYFLYLLARKYTDENTALWSCFFFTILPLNVYFSRAFMPESALIMSSILGVYFFSQWLALGKWRYFILSLSFITLACLLKIPTLYLGLPIFYLAWLKFGRKILTQWSLWVYALSVFICVGAWYYHAHQIFLQYGHTFGIWGYGTDKWGNWNMLITLKFWNKILFQHLAEKHITWPGFPVFLIGLLMKRQTKREKIFDLWLIAVVIYFIIVAKGNYVHDYYQLPFMIPAVVYIGKVYARYFRPTILLRNKASLMLAISLLGILSCGTYRYYSLMKKEDIRFSDKFELSKYVKHYTKKNSLIIAIDKGDPTLLYLSDRKGWRAHPEQINNSFLDKKIQRGAKYVVGTYEVFGKFPQKLKLLLSSRYQVILDNRIFFIVKISRE
jgi:4-amino-4-deoxy-L-arabinose transferase-like glycosyltransferase